jgi:hypothetical protein
MYRLNVLGKNKHGPWGHAFVKFQEDEYCDEVVIEVVIFLDNYSKLLKIRLRCS